MKKIFLITVICIISCNNHNHANNINIAKRDSLKSQLIGYWGTLNGNVPSFEFKEDSIFNFETKEIHSYNIVGNDLIVKFPDHNWTMKNISVVVDTMKFEEDGMIILGYRIKK